MSENKVVNIEQLFAVAQQNTYSIQGLNNILTAHESRLSQIEVAQNEQAQRITAFEQNERIDRTDQRRMRNAVHARCYFLLGIKHEGGHVAKESMSIYKGYFGAFTRKCYSDAKSHSRMGDPFSETKKRHCEEAMQYIENWQPEISYEGLTGTKAYMKYLDDLLLS